MTSLVRLAPLTLLSLALLACKPDEPANDDEVGASEDSTSQGTSADATTGTETAGETGTTGEPAEVVGLDLMTRLAGLWSGPATMTPLGTFEPMNMDLRPADGHVLFSRADLDAENSLRFGFAIETHAGEDVLVYRNGGYFQGVLRDSRTALVEHTPVDAQGQGSWRFCSITAQGCDYIDALFEFDDADHLVFDVKVMGEQHVYWLAERLEPRDLPDPFPVDSTSQGTGDAPFPTMPSLRTTVTWQDPLTEPADVWVFLSTMNCPLMGICDFSRSLRGTAEIGATSIELLHDQIHAGAYRGNAVLDRDRNLESSMFPGSGDAVTLPNQAVEVADVGESTIELFTIVEL
ncbi:hypothetical protein ACNOYE_11060 [Nannocystaceae bacterium ST9]